LRLGCCVAARRCGGDAGLRCEYSAGNLDAIKSQVAKLQAGGTTTSDVVNSLGKPTSVAPAPDGGGKTFEYSFPQALSSGSSAACPVKSQKVTFVFDSREILQSMQINF
jgi:outer membrane protein assembly factor BamE (lipoprotein component of BamABCDE complex)